MSANAESLKAGKFVAELISKSVTMENALILLLSWLTVIRCTEIMCVRNPKCTIYDDEEVTLRRVSREANAKIFVDGVVVETTHSRRTGNMFVHDAVIKDAFQSFEGTCLGTEVATVVVTVQERTVGNLTQCYRQLTCALAVAPDCLIRYTLPWR